MTLSEFKAWFEGFTEGMDGAPSEKQFDRIKAKVSEITGEPASQEVFVNRYHDYYRHWGQPIWNGNIGYSAGSVGQGVSNAALMGVKADSAPIFNSHDAMYAVGKSDAMN